MITSWSLQYGGRITDEIHRNGRSNDGTTDYLNHLIERYPNNITVYRKSIRRVLGWQIRDGKFTA